MDWAKVSVGDLVAFQIGRQEGYSAINAEKWGVVKVLFRAPDKALTLSVLDGLHATCPTASDVEHNAVLRRVRTQAVAINNDVYGGAVFQPMLINRFGLINARVIGATQVFHSGEAWACEVVRSNGHMGTFARLDFAATELDHEWRAVHDAANWHAEVEAANARLFADMQAKAERQKTRLRGLTLDTLMNEVQFAQWDAQPELTPPAFVQAMRAEAMTLLTALSEHAPKPKRAIVRAELRRFVEATNVLDVQFNHPIETQEREALVEFIEEVCWATKQKPLIDEAEAWRDW